jgi:hypothetical protein
LTSPKNSNERARISKLIRDVQLKMKLASIYGGLGFVIGSLNRHMHRVLSLVHDHTNPTCILNINKIAETQEASKAQ